MRQDQDGRQLFIGLTTLPAIKNDTTPVQREEVWGHSFHDLRHIFSNGRGGRQPRRLNSQKVNSSLPLLQYHKICLQDALVIKLGPIA